MQNPSSAAIAVLVLELAPAVLFGLAGERVRQAFSRWPSSIRTALPVLCALPYVLISCSYQMFSWKWWAGGQHLRASIKRVVLNVDRGKLGCPRSRAFRDLGFHGHVNRGILFDGATEPPLFFLHNQRAPHTFAPFATVVASLGFFGNEAR